MRDHHSDGFGFDSGELPPQPRTELDQRNLRSDAAGANSPERVLWEAGLVLAIALGIALAVNLTLVSLHIS